MKVTGAKAQPLPDPRRRAVDKAGLRLAGTQRAGDTAAFLGISAPELTPAVQGAMQTLLAELDELRTEVGRLKARLAEVEGMADRDALTPILNRRALVRELGRIRTFALRYGSSASLVYFDLDDLKSVNDRFGHAAGDAALTAVAERLAANVRDSDVVGRMGGDEFAVILVQANAALAEAKARSLASAVERDPMQFGDWSAPLHVSWGVCEITEDREPEEIVAAADQAMYARKRARRSPPT